MSDSLSYLYGHLDQYTQQWKVHQNSSSDHSSSYTLDCHSNFSASYILKWRRGKLIVQRSEKSQSVFASPLDAQEWLTSRLRNSPVQLVKLDLALGEDHLQAWAQACSRTEKKAFLRVPSVPDRPQRKHPFSWWLKRQLDWLIAAFLLVLLSPLGLILLIYSRFSNPIVSQQWCVGERGRLFRCYRFRMADGTQPKGHSSLKEASGSVEHWLTASKLDRLPMLLNVLKGEMSLVGFQPLTLKSAVHVEPELQHYLNAIPGVITISPLAKHANSSGLSSAKPCDLEYLQNWSLGWDLKFLLMKLSSF